MAVPLAGVLIFIILCIFGCPFGIIASSVTPLYWHIPIPFVEIYACIFLLLIGITASIFAMKKQKREEVA